jgi:PilZ domain
MQERRKHPRELVDQTAYISVDGSSTRCQIVNISADGAALEVHNATYIPSRFKLMLAEDRQVRECRIVWIMQNRIGVQWLAADLPDQAADP